MFKMFELFLDNTGRESQSEIVELCVIDNDQRNHTVIQRTIMEILESLDV